MDRGAMIYLSQTERIMYKKEIAFFKEFYDSSIQPLFNDNIIEKGIEESVINGREEYLRTACTEYPDESDYYNSGEKCGYEKYLYYKILKNNIKLSLISTAFQFWIQQLRKFLYRKFITNGMLEKNISITRFFPKGYSDFKTHLNKFIKISDELWSELWNEVINIDSLNNAIKHGAGKSEESLKEEKPEWFLEPSNYRDSFSSEGSNLDSSKINVNDICNTLQKFWDMFPNKSDCLKDYDTNINK